MTEKQSENEDLIAKNPNKKREICNDFINGDDLAQEDGPADIVFIVSGKRLPAHRNVIATKSEFFRALLIGGFAESKQNEILIEAPLKLFEIILNFLYSGYISFEDIDNDDILELLDLANLYDIKILLSIISMYFSQIINGDNVLIVLCKSRLYNLEQLQITCLKYIDRNGLDILRNENFPFLSQNLVEEIISRESFYAPEIDIFLAIVTWAIINPTIDIKPLLTHVRFSKMDESDLNDIVLPSSILTLDELIEYQEKESKYNYLPYRGLSVNEKLVVQSCTGFEGGLYFGEKNEIFWDDDGNMNTIVVDLGNTYITNNIEFSLCLNPTPYYIEISTNGKDWNRIVDYMDCMCQSSQELYFPVSPVAFVRISNDSGMEEKSMPLNVKYLTLLYTKEVPEMINGYIKPVKNVIRRFTQSILSGSLKHMYNPMNMNRVSFIYVSGKLSYPITVQLNQPYIIGKMGIHILDYASLPSSFCCESSLDSETWTMLLDKRKCDLIERYCFEFEPRPIVFLRFVGTPNPNNTSPIFCISKLECPPDDIAMFSHIQLIRSMNSCNRL